MAFYNEDEDETGQGQLAGQQAPAAPGASQDQQAGTATSKESSAISGAAGPGSNTAAKTAPGGSGQKGNNFVGIQQYLDQNKSQSAKLAKDVAGTVDAAGNQARNTLSNQQNAFNQAVDQNTVNLNQGLVDEAKTNAQGVASDAQKKAEFQRMRDANYAGPQGFEGSEYYQPVAQDIQKAQAAAQNTQSEAGQRSLISDVQKNTNKGRVERGALTFDSALLAADPTARQTLGEAKDRQADLSESLNKAAAEGNAKAQAAKNTTQATRDAIRQQFSGEQGVQAQLERDLQTRAAEAQQGSKNTTNRIIDALKTNRGADLSDADLGLLGISRNDLEIAQRDMDDLQRNNINFDANLGRYATALDPNAGINARNIASADEYARYAALNDLMGGSGSFLSDPSQAGRSNADSVDFNLNQLFADLQKARADGLSQANQLQAGGGGGGSNKSLGDIMWDSTQRLGQAGVDAIFNNPIVNNPIVNPITAATIPAVNNAVKKWKKW